MDGCPAPLEKIFQKLEEESERRAEKEKLRPDLELGGSTLENPTESATIPRTKGRRRGSVSISRICQPEDTSNTPTTPTLPTIVAKVPFYQSQMTNHSTTSIASGASAFSNDHAHKEDDNHVTQMRHIVGKQSISAKMLPRRLSRSHSASVIPTMGGQNSEPPVIIGVIVQEATVESTPGPEDAKDGTVTKSRRASVSAQASGTLRHQPSRSTLSGLKVTKASWFTTFTQKLRGKTKTSIPSGPLSSYL